MAEILIRVTDKINTDDFYADCQCTKRGDVVVSSPDGWGWGREELSLPFYRIIKLPTLKQDVTDAMIMPEIDVDPLNPSKTLQKRGFKLNIDDPSISPKLQAYLADDKRQSQFFVADDNDTNTLTTLKVAKPPIADPAVFGASPIIF